MGAIRLFLALGVVAAHFHDQVLSHIGLAMDSRWLFNIVGGRSVIFFYVISGFLISYTLHNKYPPTPAGTRAFFRSRFLRIYPLWWALLLTCLVIGLHPASPIASLFSITLFGTDWLVAFWHYPETYWGLFSSGSGIGWTLGAELTFYTMAPWLLRSPIICVTLLILSAACRGAAFWLVGPHTPTYFIWSYFFFPSTLMFFLLGHFTNVLHSRVKLGLPISLLLLLATAAGFTCFSVPMSVDYVTDYIFCVCFTLALPTIFAATKDSRGFNFLGDLTYPLYLTHALTIAALFWHWPIPDKIGEGLLRTARFFDPIWLQSLVLLAEGMAFALAIAVPVHLIVEIPLRAATVWFLDKRYWRRGFEPNKLAEHRRAPHANLDLPVS